MIEESFSLFVEGGGAHSTDITRTYEASSLIKVAILYFTLTELKRTKSSLNKPLRVKQRHISNGSGVIAWQKRRTYTIRQLFKLILEISDSTAANVLIDYAGGPVAFRAQLAEAYPKTVMTKDYINFQDNDHELAVTSCTDSLNMVTDVYRLASQDFGLSKLMRRSSNRAYTWFINQVPDSYEPLLIKTGSMHDYDEKNSYVLNAVAILKRTSDEKICHLSYLSRGEALDSSGEAILARKDSASFMLFSKLDSL